MSWPRDRETVEGPQGQSAVGILLSKTSAQHHYDQGPSFQKLPAIQDRWSNVLGVPLDPEIITYSTRMILTTETFSLKAEIRETSIPDGQRNVPARLRASYEWTLFLPVSDSPGASQGKYSRKNCHNKSNL